MSWYNPGDTLIKLNPFDQPFRLFEYWYVSAFCIGGLKGEFNVEIYSRLFMI